MQNERKHNPPASPANSSSKKRHQNNLLAVAGAAAAAAGGAPTRFSGPHPLSDSDIDDTQIPRRRSATARNMSELLTTKPAKNGRRQDTLSSRFPSKKRMSTSSPVFRSPMSSLSDEFFCDSPDSGDPDLSFASADHSFCIMTNDGKMTEKGNCRREGVGMSRKVGMRSKDKNSVDGKEDNGKEREREKLGKRVGKRMTNEHRVSLGKSNMEGLEKFATKEKDEEEDKKRSKSLQNRPNPPPLSSDDDNCSGGSNSSSGHESSDVDSRVEVRRRQAAQARSKPTICTPRAETRKNDVEDRMII